MINPFVFNKRIKAVVISYKASPEFKLMLNNLNIDIIDTLPLDNVDIPVNDHPDLVVHPVNYKDIVVYKEHFNYYQKKLNKYGVNIISSKNSIYKKYPEDIYLNISRVGEYYFHKKDYIDEILEVRLKENYTSMEVKQGYAKCSSMIIKDDTVITTDFKLHKKYTSLGLHSYLLPADYIDLPGYNTGFIGGTCGNIGKDELIFYGNLEKYKYADKLREILEKEKIEYYYPKTESFVDRGSIIGILGG